MKNEHFCGIVNLGLVMAQDSLHFGAIPKNAFWTVVHYLGYIFVAIALFAIGTKAAEIAIDSNLCLIATAKCKYDKTIERIELVFGLLGVAVLFLIGCFIVHIGD